MGGRGSSGNRNNSNNFKRFLGRMEDGKRYEGSGDDVETFFQQNSNVKELIDSMTDSEIRRFQDWVSGLFMFNKKSYENLSQEDRDRLNTYDKYLNQSVLKQGIEVRRLTDWKMFGHKKSLEQLENLKGKELTLEHNLSTGAAEEGLLMYSDYRTKPVEMVLKIPGGTKGAGMYIGDSRINPNFRNKQREFMTNRNIQVKIGRSYYDSRRGIIVVEMTYLGRKS